MVAKGAQNSGVRPELTAGCVSYNSWWIRNVLSALRSRAELSCSPDLSTGLPAISTGLQCQAHCVLTCCFNLGFLLNRDPEKPCSRTMDSVFLSLRWFTFGCVKWPVKTILLSVLLDQREQCGFSDHLQTPYALWKGSAQGLCFLFGCVFCRCEGYLHVWLDLEEDKQVGVCFDAPSDCSAPWRWNQF